jgi:ankyrin repeat protein
LIPLLLDAGADIDAVNFSADTPLALGVRSLEIVRNLLARGARVHVPGAVNPLAPAIKAGSDAVMELLLDAGAGVNEANQAGVTMLMKAAQAGRLSLVQMLVDSGADVNAHDDQDMTAMSLAVQHPGALVSYLREAGGFCGALYGKHAVTLHPDHMLHRVFVGIPVSEEDSERATHARFWSAHLDAMVALAHVTAWIRRKHAVRLWRLQWPRGAD